MQKTQKTVALEDVVSEVATFSSFADTGAAEPQGEFVLSPDCVLSREGVEGREAAAAVADGGGAAADGEGAVVLRLQSTSTVWLIRGETDEQTAVWSAALSHHISHSSLHSAAVRLLRTISPSTHARHALCEQLHTTNSRFVLSCASALFFLFSPSTRCMKRWTLLSRTHWRSKLRCTKYR